MVQTARLGQILQIGETIRIEPGPVRKQAEASLALLDDAVTAAHYQPPRDASAEEIADPSIPTPDGKVYALDALGQRIEIGKPMTYLDWVGHSERADGATGFYVYRREAMTAEEIAERGIDKLPTEAQAEAALIWREIGCEPSEEAAISLAFMTLNPA